MTCPGPMKPRRCFYVYLIRRKIIMLRFMSLSSGSCGNCYYLEHEDDMGRHAVIIDAGVSLRRLKQILGANGLDENSFGAILITHDHMDHIRSLASYCKKLHKPVYATPVLHAALASHSFGAPYVGQCRCDLAENEWNDINGFRVRYFIVPHDATQTVGYYIQAGDRKFVIMTDIGRMTDEAVRFASEADTVVVESNYDMDMLISGPYTYELKMRICKGHGHLSNDECAFAIHRFWHKGLKNIFLCHLSDHNNTPELADKSAREALRQLGVEDGTVNLRALPRQTPSQMFVL